MTKNDDKRIPALRFKGFNDDWAQRKLGDYITVNKIKNKENNHFIPYSISNKWGFIPQEKQFGEGNTYSKTNKATNYIVEPNTFAYNPARINVGSIAYQNNQFPVIVSSLYEIFKAKKNLNDEFLMNWFKTEKFTRQIQKLQEGGVRQYFFIDKMQESRITIPFISEQEEISKTLNQISNLIKLQQRKLKQYQLIKKWLCSVVFNDTVHDDANILFSNRVKANQLFESISKKGFKDLPVLSASQEKGMVFRDDISKNITYTNSNLNNYKLVSPGNFVVHLRSFQGGFSYSNKIGIASPAYTIFEFKDNIKYDSIFWKEKFKSYNFIQLLKKVTYGVRDGRSISFSDFLSLYLAFPDIEIQKKIGKCFKALDNQISDQQCIIQQLKQLKQFLLQNMFI